MNQEQELINARSKVKNYTQAKIGMMASIDRFEMAQEEQGVVEDRKVYQALGKAFLRRPKEELKEDFTSLIDTNKKELEEVNV